jgi:hypothetical protein
MLGFRCTEQQPVEGIAVSLRQLHGGQYVLVAHGQDDGATRSHLVAEAPRRHGELAETMLEGDLPDTINSRDAFESRGLAVKLSSAISEGREAVS